MTRSILSLMLAVAPRPSQNDDKTVTINTNCKLFSLEDTVEQRSRAYFENFASTDDYLVGVASLNTSTTDLKANHSGMSAPLRSNCLNLVPDSFS